jgi:hypothetical protein
MNTAKKIQATRNETLTAIAAIEGILGHEYTGPLFSEVRNSSDRGTDIAVALRWLYKADGANIETSAGPLLSLAFGRARDAFLADFATVR